MSKMEERGNTRWQFLLLAINGHSIAERAATHQLLWLYLRGSPFKLGTGMNSMWEKKVELWNKHQPRHTIMRIEYDLGGNFLKGLLQQIPLANPVSVLWHVPCQVAQCRLLLFKLKAGIIGEYLWHFAEGGEKSEERCNRLQRWCTEWVMQLPFFGFENNVYCGSRDHWPRSQLEVSWL